MFEVFYGITIALYAYNPKIGIFPLLFVIVKNLVSKKELKEKIIRVLILLLPFSFCNINLVGYTTFFSLFDIFLYCLFIIFLSEMRVKKETINVILIVMILFVLVRFIFATNMSASIYSTISVIIMLLTIFLAYNSNKKTDKINEYFELYNKVGIACVVALIISYLLYQKGIIIGNISVMGNNSNSLRVNYNLLFNSYSYLSAYFATCFTSAVCYSNRFKTKLQLIIYIILYIIGIMISSSRTGIITVLLISIIMYIKSINFSKLSLKKGLILLCAIVGSIIVYNMFIALRPEASSFFETFGRIERWEYGLNIFLHYPLFGYGFYNSNDYLPLAHNFIIEYLSEGGLTFSILFGIILFNLIKKMKNVKYKYVFYAVLIGNLFYTCLHENKFMYIILIIILQSNLLDIGVDKNEK